LNEEKEARAKIETEMRELKDTSKELVSQLKSLQEG
jgi:hypothetical protein